MPKILLVEDNAANGDMLTRRLQRVGYEVVSAADGEVAVAMASSEVPDLILMDLSLPVLDGWAATRRIKDCDGTCAIPIIALTAHAMSEDRERATDAGCDDYETKPVNLQRLLGKIESHLRSASESLIQTSSQPLKQVPAVAVNADAPPMSQPDEGRLLIVDDTPANRDVLARRFRRSGYVVETASDGAEALASLRNSPFDLVLLDMMMPGLSGLDVLDDLRRTHPATELPVIMVTALDSTADIVNAFDHGANDYVTKPLDFAVIHARVQTQLALKRAIDQIRALERDLAQRNRALHAANERMTSDLEAAVKVQAALLPTESPHVPGYHFAWLFNPSAELAGDIFNVFRLDDRHVGIYVLDVTGHGVAAALLSVTVSRFLFPLPDPTSLLWETSASGETRLSRPARVAQRLSERFPFDAVTGQFFTLVYGVLDLQENRLRYTSAGHPQLVAHRRGAKPTFLEASGFPIGVGPGDYDEYEIDLASGDRLYIYSDGIPETMNPDGEPFGPDRLLKTLDAGQDVSADQSLEHLCSEICRWSAADRCQDDQTVVCIARS
jgi:sigma-B regulation protein RsbU (phosphoserine phosphatase)